MKAKSLFTKVKELLTEEVAPLPVRKEVRETSYPERVSDVQIKPIAGGEDLPVGGWRGGEEIPTGGWRGGEEIPTGGWRGGEEIPVGGWRGGEEIPEGGWRASSTSSFLNSLLGLGMNEKPPIHDVYRTKDGRYFFEFVFYWTGNYYDIDIFKMPSYGTRSEDAHKTHRLNSERGGYKICFGDPYMIDSLSEGRKWAGTWAECTMNYIKYGENFPNE